MGLSWFSAGVTFQNRTRRVRTTSRWVGECDGDVRGRWWTGGLSPYPSYDPERGNALFHDVGAGADGMVLREE